MLSVLPGGLLLHWNSYGDSSKPPLLCCHASFSTGSESFLELAPELGRLFWMIVPDFRGHGESSVAEAFWDEPLLARDMLSFLKLLGLKRVKVLGHSMGGDVAMELASKGDGLVESLVSIGSDGASNPSITEALSKYAPDSGLEKRCPRFVAHLKRLHGVGSKGDWRRFAAQTLDSCSKWPDFSDAELARIDMPFLLVYGENDIYVPSREFERLKRLCPKFESLCIKGCGHYPHRGPTKKECMEAIVSFLTKEGRI